MIEIDFVGGPWDGQTSKVAIGVIAMKFTCTNNFYDNTKETGHEYRLNDLGQMVYVGVVPGITCPQVEWAK